jgi:hypothetical protein
VGRKQSEGHQEVAGIGNKAKKMEYSLAINPQAVFRMQREA